MFRHSFSDLVLIRGGKKNPKITEFLIFFLLVFLTRFFMDEVYALSISPVFDYAKFINESTYISTLVSWILLIVMSLFACPFLSPNKDDFISSVVLVLFIIRVVSFTSFIKYSPQPPLFIAYNVFYWCWFLLLLNSNFFAFNKRIKNNSSHTVVNICAIIAMISVVAVSGLYTGFRLHFSLEDVYELREEARGYSVPFVLSYLTAATGNVIPVLVVYYIFKKKKWFVVALVFVGFLNFGIAGQKATLFKIIACVAMIFMRNTNLRKWIVPLLTGVLGLALVLYVLFENVAISWVLVRRMFYIPNIIDSIYFDYFATHTPLYFDSNATGQLAFDITTEYGGREGARSNNGLFTDAIQNIGVLGLVIMPIVLTILLRAFSQVLKRQPQSIVFFVSIVIATTLHSNLFTRCLFTHGFVFLFVVLYFMPGRKVCPPTATIVPSKRMVSSQF